MRDDIPEDVRLKALAGLRVMESEREAIFDDLVTMAAEIWRAPIAAMSLVDEKRQWFKAARGLSVRETPREH